ncbi:hypothetical protein B0J18DRAFT_282392 [Chaetomium sp. MPI-SDFR-AT-0129]|nr:hypothetical protein B0J18DRAFT_282392 [Chaetomium sp. MPI-SDFR-AT-0129]
MDTVYRSPLRRAGRARFRLPDLALIAGLFLSPASVVPASAAAVGQQHESASLHARTEGEHVVLADCRDPAGVLSSQMAYFKGPVGATPTDVAVVATPNGQTTLWVNANTTGLFTTTSVKFTANLGPRVEEGQFAGTGNNGYGNFSCYQQYIAELYTYENTKCSQVYQCDHSKPPAGGISSSSSSGMSQGTIIGIAVGVVGGILFLVAAGLVFWYLRRSRRAKAGHSILPSDRSTTLTAGPGSDNGEPKAPSTVQTPVSAHSQPHPALRYQVNHGGVYEMDGRLFRIEMAEDNGRYEMSAQGHGTAELDTAKSGPALPAHTRELLHTQPPFPDSPLELGQPQSPPPEYAR